MRRIMGLLIPALLLAVPSAYGHHVKLTEAGKGVEVIEAEAAKACKYRGQLFSTKKAKDEGGGPSAMADLRNRVAASGNNAMVVVSKYPFRAHTDIVVNVYRCRK